MQNFEQTFGFIAHDKISRSKEILIHETGKYIVSDCRSVEQYITDLNGNQVMGIFAVECSLNSAMQNSEEYARQNFKLNVWHNTKINGKFRMLKITRIWAISIKPVGNF